MKAFAGEEDVKFDNYDVFLSYKDNEGDLTIIHNDEDLMAALEEYKDAGQINILAQVQAKPLLETNEHSNNIGAQGMLLDTNETASPAAVSNDQSARSSPAAVSIDLNTNSPDGKMDEGPLQIVVQGAGTAAVDGVYSRGYVVSNAWSYAKDGLWNGKNCTFHIFQCTTSNNRRYWYLSIVPPGKIPGKKSDIDFYQAPVRNVCVREPPKSGWAAVKEGRGPSPRLRFRFTTDP